MPETRLHDPDSPRDVLGERLRREAMASRPEFSDDLHARLCLAIGHVDVRPTPTPAAADRAPRGLLAVAVVVALCMASAIAWRSIQWSPAASDEDSSMIADRGSQERKDEPGPLVDPLTGIATFSQFADQATEQLDVLVASAVQKQQWADLDHDAQLMWESIAAQLPFEVPSSLPSSALVAWAGDNPPDE